jgi:hypothetical protein
MKIWDYIYTITLVSKLALSVCIPILQMENACFALAVVVIVHQVPIKNAWTANQGSFYLMDNAL